MFKQRHVNVDATSWRFIGVEATLHKRHVPARMDLSIIVVYVWSYVMKLRLQDILD